MGRAHGANVSTTTLTPFLPSRSGPPAAVLVALGGGFRLAVDQQRGLEGGPLADRGVAAFVLKYRLFPRRTTSPA